MSKIVCGTRPLKEGEVFGTYEQCKKKNQIRLWGIKEAPKEEEESKFDKYKRMFAELGKEVKKINDIILDKKRKDGSMKFGLKQRMSDLGGEIKRLTDERRGKPITKAIQSKIDRHAMMEKKYEDYSKRKEEIISKRHKIKRIIQKEYNISLQ